MMISAEYQQAIAAGTLIPYLGPGALSGVVGATGEPIPADSHSLILALNGGRPMAPKLMYEFPRAAMNVELKRGRSAVVKFLDTLYRDTVWQPSPLYRWLGESDIRYIVDTNRDTLLQQAWADRPHLLVVGVARIGGTPYRFRIYQRRQGEYHEIDQQAMDPALPILFKPLGTPIPHSDYIAADADFVDYITELMGGFAIPEGIKQRRLGQRYLSIGLNFDRDTERMVFSDITWGADADRAIALMASPPGPKVKRWLARQGMRWEVMI
jgi:hypothetical protein